MTEPSRGTSPAVAHLREHWRWYTLGGATILSYIIWGATGPLVLAALLLFIVAGLLTGSRRTVMGLRGKRKGRILAGAGIVALLAAGAVHDTDPPPTPPVATGATTPADPPAPAPNPVTSEPSPPPAEPEPAVSAETEPATQAEAEPEIAEVVAEPGTALAVLTDLPVKGRAAKTGYDRDLFQYRAYDQDRNGCDVRNDILRRDLDEVVIKADSNGCVVTSGTLQDPYSAELIQFERGQDTSNDVQIDHVVALSDAWQKGAQGWDDNTLREFGNDPLNLLAVAGQVNSQKGDGDAATWLPPNKSYRCGYVARQVAVKHKYDLWLAEAERDAIQRILSDCPDEPLPVAETVDLAPELSVAPEPELATAPVGLVGSGAEDEPEEDLDPDFGTCKEAIKAGYGPYDKDRDPEYHWYRDGDKDGTVCER